MRDTQTARKERLRGRKREKVNNDRLLESKGKGTAGEKERLGKE